MYKEICGCIHYDDATGAEKICVPGQSLDGLPQEVIELARTWTAEQIAGHDATAIIEQALAAQAEATRQDLFAEYDKKVLQYQREVRLGIAGAEERLAAWDAYAEALRAINDTDDWYLNPQWPTPPEE